MKYILEKIRSIFGFAPKPRSQECGKILVHFSDNMIALADNQDAAQALVMQRCLNSMEPVFADFYDATQEDIEWFRARKEEEEIP